MEYPKVSIITPSYNQGEFIERTILSVKNQDYPNIQHIVIDGGSTDGTLDILHKYSHDIIWISEPDEGQADAINKGLKIARGKIIGWLNSDDTYLSGAVRTVVYFFRKYREAFVVTGNLVVIDENDNFVKRTEAQRVDFHRLMNYNASIIQPATFIRQEVIDTIGLLDTRFDYAMDYEYWLRIASQYNLCTVDKDLACFRITKSSKTATSQWKFAGEILKAQQLHRGKLLCPLVLKTVFYITKELPRRIKPLRRLVRKAKIKLGYWKVDPSNMDIYL